MEVVMDRKEFLLKVKTELRAFYFLLERYGDPVKAYEVWKGEYQFNISSMLEGIIFDGMKGVDEIKKELDVYCKLIDEDLWWLERNLDFGVYADEYSVV